MIHSDDPLANTISFDYLICSVMKGKQAHRRRRARLHDNPYDFHTERDKFMSWRNGWFQMRAIIEKEKIVWNHRYATRMGWPRQRLGP